jgi:hypothetical protein
MIDNIELIKSIISFSSTDVFYFLEIIKRRKDNPEMDKPEAIVKDYTICSMEQLNKLYPRIIEKCITNNARAYIRLNSRSHEQVGLYTNKIIAELLCNKQYQAIKNAYWSACGKHSNDPDNKWVIDIDEDNLNNIEQISAEIENIYATEKSSKQRRIIATIPTKSGVHLICNPFNPNSFWFNKLIHKDSPTILYIP